MFDATFAILSRSVRISGDSVPKSTRFASGCSLFQFVRKLSVEKTSPSSFCLLGFALPRRCSIVAATALRLSTGRLFITP
jgi:hypothetical protein